LLLTQEQWAIIEKGFQNSTSRSLNDYFRKVIFDKPVTSFYRNRSIDEFINELILLRKEIRLIREQLPEGPKDERIIELLRAFDQLQLSINQFLDHVCQDHLYQKAHQHTPVQ
jgi:hypothetical protein